MIMAGIVSSAITFQSVTTSALAEGAVPASVRSTVATVAERVMQAASEDQTDITISCDRFGRGAGQSGRTFRSARTKQTSVDRPTDGLLLTFLLSQARLGSIRGASWASLLSGENAPLSAPSRR